MALTSDDRMQLVSFALHDLQLTLHALHSRARAIITARDAQFVQEPDPWVHVLLEPGDSYGRHSLSALLAHIGGTASLQPKQADSLLPTALRGLDNVRIQLENACGLLDDNDQSTNRQSVMLDPICREVVDLLEPLAGEKGITIETNFQNELVVYANAALLFRMLFNLVENAIKYSYATTPESESRYVSVRGRRHTIGGDCLVECTSYGVGILPEEIESGSIFEYGARGKLARDRDRKGTGLGLAEVKRIVKLHSGSVSVTSQAVGSEMSGQRPHVTTFKVILPK